MHFCRKPWAVPSAFGPMMVLAFLAGAQAQAQQPDAAAPAGQVIRTETRLVLVDTVVTDKKGNYLRDLTLKDFRVWEDDKEQTVKSFSFEAEPASPSASRAHYLVLFFDNSTMNTMDQMRARKAAAKFVEGSAGPNRLTAVVNFSGTVRVAQNFTADAERLKQVVGGLQTSAMGTNAQAPVQIASMGAPSLGRAAAEFGARSVLLALRSVAKNLASVPGRKTLILLTAGFPLTDQSRSELTATIAACNRSNVAVYPIDVRGLVSDSVGMGPLGPRGAVTGFPSGLEPNGSNPEASGYTAAARPGYSFLRLASFGGPSFAFAQRPGGGAGGGAGGGGGGIGGGGSSGGGRGGSGGASPGGSGGSTGGGSTGGGRTGGGTTGGGTTGGGTTGGKTGGGTIGGGKTGGGTTGGGPGARGGSGGYGRNNPNNSYNPNNPYSNNPMNQSRMLIPEMRPSASTNQQVLYALAEGTGGFVIVNTNDLVAGLQKIGSEQDQYYIVSYTPAESAEGSCHTLRVKVNRGGTIVRARSGYCDVKPVDLLAGKPIEKELESRVTGSESGNMAASMAVPFFYTAPNTARVNVAMEIPTGSIKFEKVKGKQHAELNLLGVAYKPDGTVGARFSDTVKLDFDGKKEAQEFTKQPMHYENQFDAASGSYTLKVAVTSGRESFGKVEMPLVVEPYDSKQFSLSGIALSKEFRAVADLGTGLDAELLEGRVPLVAKGVQITPSGSSRFKNTEKVVVYLEIYEPLLVDPNPPIVGLQLRIVNRKTGEQKHDSGLLNVSNMFLPGNPVVPIGVPLPTAALGPGAYRLEFRAVDSTDRVSTRAAEFELE
jgi:VWFA-related protein